MNWGQELAAIYHRFGDRIGVIDAEGAHTIANVMEGAAGIAHRLGRLGLGPGSNVATIFHNSARAVSASYGVALGGACEVPINPLLSRDELAHALSCANVRLVLIDGADPLPDIAPFPTTLGSDGPAISSAQMLDVRAIPSLPLSGDGWPEVALEAPSRVVFTSGTTGPAKGAIHTHAGRWAGAVMLRASLSFLADRSNRILLMTPFSHGSSLLTFAYLSEGASVNLVRGADVTTVVPLMASGTITEVFAPPTVLAKLTEAALQPDYMGLSFPLRMILTGTAPLAPTVYEKAAARFGEIIRVTYGKSEVFNPITVLSPPETAEAYRSDTGEGLCVGWPATGVRIKIRDDAKNTVVTGETGRIFLQSPHLSIGYMTPAGLKLREPGEYHDTGDLGRIDERGRLFLVSRQSDMMKTGGYKVSPDEVERALALTLSGTDFVVVGYPSDYWGEIITVIAQNPPENWQDRLACAAQSMTSYKRPRLFAEIDHMPRNSIGKIVRAHLRRWLVDTYELIDSPRPRLVLRGKAGK
ncbi:class I adenylate-forming enzyme family protein [Paracoccus sp. (in: a-proteobacteria)]|uniref:class I adenylate-forming enzyme family protein n=1 Tax=Paracoccus sp. TaxID=267 RepID=UPI00289CEAF7|nr:class I adenylate-forming enzyme family protein [Paracoccus sp. (in: a-proteobacteria)]